MQVSEDISRAVAGLSWVLLGAGGAFLVSALAPGETPHGIRHPTALALARAVAAAVAVVVALVVAGRPPRAPSVT